MSQLFTYICTRSTADPYLPPVADSLPRLARDVSDGFLALSGGYVTAGQLAFFPLQRSVPNHLLCDGREVEKASFPELYSYLGDSQGTAAEATRFVLPNFIDQPLAPAPTAEVETEEAGTVSTPPPVVEPTPNWYNNYGDADSGGRRFNKFARGEIEPE